MRALQGILGLAFVAFVAYVLVGSDAQRHQVDAGPIVPPEGVYNPVRAGEPTPSGFRQLLARDAILPVYNPTFVSAAAVDWDDATLVIGLEIEGDARAYPVSFLNRREMVNDDVGGEPVLVSW